MAQVWPRCGPGVVRARAVASHCRRRLVGRAALYGADSGVSRSRNDIGSALMPDRDRIGAPPQRWRGKLVVSAGGGSSGLVPVGRGVGEYDGVCFLGGNCRRGAA